MPLPASALSAMTAVEHNAARSFSPLLSVVVEAVGNYCFRILFEDDPRRRAQLQPLGTGPPAERKRAENQLPMAANGQVAPYLVVAPSQGVLALLVALLHPHPQAVQPDHFRQARRSE